MHHHLCLFSTEVKSAKMWEQFLHNKVAIFSVSIFRLEDELLQKLEAFLTMQHLLSIVLSIMLPICQRWMPWIWPTNFSELLSPSRRQLKCLGFLDDLNRLCLFTVPRKPKNAFSWEYNRLQHKWSLYSLHHWMWNTTAAWKHLRAV